MHDEHVVGMLSQSALGGVHGLRRFPGMPTPRVRELMEPHLFAVEPDTDVREVAKVLRDLSLDAMPVMVGGLLLGIVTRSDLLDVVAAG
jgi:CBS domain-containing protein